VTPGQQGDQGLIDHLFLAKNHLGDAGLYFGQAATEGVHFVGGGVRNRSQGGSFLGGACRFGHWEAPGLLPALAVGKLPQKPIMETLPISNDLAPQSNELATQFMALRAIAPYV
jgi:hypothetical protein